MVSRFVNFIEKYHAEELGRNRFMEVLILLTVSEHISRLGPKFTAKAHVVFVKRMGVDIALKDAMSPLPETVKKDLGDFFNGEMNRFLQAYRFNLPRFVEILLTRKNLVHSMENQVSSLLKRIILQPLVDPEYSPKSDIEHLFLIFKEFSSLMSF